ncbi:MAG TPA: hypothetical protein VHV77_02065, partial [Pirellulales bacterium]|nr:hypothetical protein [Pirellulales bacterium]
MSARIARRRFLTSASATTALGSLVDLGFLRGLPAVSAAEAKSVKHAVRFDPEIEPLVSLLEDSPRDKLLERVAAEIHAGRSYREIVSALMLAGVRNVKPRPEVGFKFHAVLVVNSALLASLSGPDEHRWLPIFWALDYFKEAQADQQRKEAWVMQPTNDALLPSVTEAPKAFCKAMDTWDEGAADAAIARLARSAGLQETYELFYRYAARDFRSIGHKAIFVANSRRALDCLGAEHAEPVMRSLAFALLMHEGDNPADRDAPADRSWRANVPRAKTLREDWLSGTVDRSVTNELLDILRTESSDDASIAVVETINRGSSPQAIWDAIFVAAGELLMQQPAIVPLHAITTSNALNYLWRSSGDDKTRRMLLLQAAAFVPYFREAATGRGKLADLRIDTLEPKALSSSGPDAIGEILSDVSSDPLSAAQ